MEETLIESWNVGLVTLSYMISAAGAYSSLIFVQNTIESRTPGRYFIQLACAAICFGGVGIWAMHFIGMQALNIGRTVVFDVLLTVISLVAAVIVPFLALFLMSWKADFSTPSPLRLLLGGLGAGAGVSTMHYLGMYAMSIDKGMMTYRAGVVTVSVIVGVLAATAALWILIYLKGEFARLLAAFIMALAVCSMHYSGMMGMEYYHSSGAVLTPEKVASSFAGSSIGLIVGVAAGLLMFFMLIIVITNLSFQQRQLKSLGRKLWRRIPETNALSEKILKRSKNLLDVHVRGSESNKQANTSK